MKLLHLMLTLLGWDLLAFGAVSQDAPVTAVQAEIYTITDALNGFQNDCGRYPSTQEGLVALDKRPASIPEDRWRGPYIETSFFKDRWGHNFVYRYPGLHKTNGFDLYSLGRDGRSNSGGDDLDDINNWNPRSPLGTGYGLGRLSDHQSMVFGGVVLLVGLGLWCWWVALRRKAQNGMA